MIKAGLYRQLSLFTLLLILADVALSQEKDSTRKVESHFGGSVTITNKGISTIPNLTLGKPAAIFIMSAGRKISFDPEFRISLEGKPWMFIFWWRYDILNNDKFLVRIRANPALVFNQNSVTINGNPKDVLVASRTFTADISPNYFIARNISIGPYYMYVYGIEKDAIKNTHFLALRANFYNIRVPGQFYLRFNPQIYYLKMDENHGFYVNGTLSLARRNFPFAISGLISKTLTTEIPFGENFLWNVSLSYTFNKNYVEK